MPGSASSAPARFCSSTIGRSADSRSVRSAAPIPTSAPSEATLAAITANGFASRDLRSRSVATAAPWRASQARW